MHFSAKVYCKVVFKSVKNSEAIYFIAIFTIKQNNMDVSENVEMAST